MPEADAEGDTPLANERKTILHDRRH
jgi:hypothetical protein